jgi:hypothetical protein
MLIVWLFAGWHGENVRFRHAKNSRFGSKSAIIRFPANVTFGERKKTERTIVARSANCILMEPNS